MNTDFNKLSRFEFTYKRLKVVQDQVSKNLGIKEAGEYEGKVYIGFLPSFRSQSWSHIAKVPSTNYW